MPVGSLSRSARGVEALSRARLRLEQIEQELENQKREIKRLEEVELPAAFTEDGIAELRLPTGERAQRHVSVQGSFPDEETNPERHREAVRIWSELGFADTIRVDIRASYGPGDAETAAVVYDTLRGDNRAVVTRKQTVHHSTLRAGVLQRVRAAQPTPVEELGCVVIRRVRLTTPPRMSTARRVTGHSNQGDIEQEDL